MTADPLSAPFLRASRNPCRRKKDREGGHQSRYGAREVRASEANLLNRGDVGSRDRSGHDPRLKDDVGLELGVPRHRLDEALDFSELSGSSRLLLMGVLELGGLGDGFPECDSRLSGLALYSVLSLESLDVDLEVELSHSGDDGLQKTRKEENTSATRPATAKTRGIALVEESSDEKNRLNKPPSTRSRRERGT